MLNLYSDLLISTGNNLTACFSIQALLVDLYTYFSMILLHNILFNQTMLSFVCVENNGTLPWVQIYRRQYWQCSPTHRAIILIYLHPVVLLYQWDYLKDTIDSVNVQIYLILSVSAQMCFIERSYQPNLPGHAVQ